MWREKFSLTLFIAIYLTSWSFNILITCHPIEVPNDENDHIRRRTNPVSGQVDPSLNEIEEILPYESSYYSSYYPSPYAWPSEAIRPQYKYVSRVKAPPSPAKYTRALMRAEGKIPPTDLASMDPATVPTNETTAKSKVLNELNHTTGNHSDEESDFYNPKPHIGELVSEEPLPPPNYYAPNLPPPTPAVTRRANDDFSDRPLFRSPFRGENFYGGQPIRLTDFINPFAPRVTRRPGRIGNWITRTFLEPLFEPL